MAVEAGRLLLLQPNNVHVIKPSGHDSQSVGSEGRWERQERLMS